LYAADFAVDVLLALLGGGDISVRIVRFFEARLGDSSAFMLLDGERGGA
jgi:hypothetical protein